MLWRENDVAYVLVLVWAFIGIAKSQADTALVANATRITSGILVFAIIVVSFYKWRSAQRT
jgi:hypothetical protein